MPEHPLDRLARRVAAAEGRMSRRRFLISSAAFAAGSAVTVRIPAVAAAATTTSCDCQGYGDSVYIDCWTEYVDNGGPYNDSDGAVAAIQFGIVNKGAQYTCLPKGDAAQANCQQVPCPAGQNCVTKPMSAPACQDDCGNGCGSGQACCGGTCVDIATDSDNCGSCGHVCITGSVCENGHCVKAKCSPKCSGSELCCESNLVAGTFMCIDPQTNDTNCGACGNACEGMTYCCKGGCIDLSSDAQNCGGCGIVCGSGQICCGATCIPACGAGGMCCEGAFGTGCYAAACCGCTEPAECCPVNGVPTCCPNGCHETIDFTFVCA